MDGPSAVFYDFSGHHIDDGQNQSPEATPRQCSVRGCTQFVTDGLNNKMCDACRGRHRIYATTKRARRKLEKAAVANSALPGGNALALIHDSNSAIVVEKDQAAPNIWMGSGQIIMEQVSALLALFSAFGVVSMEEKSSQVLASGSQSDCVERDMYN
jgi:hypothetical protein